MGSKLLATQRRTSKISKADLSSLTWRYGAGNNKEIHQWPASTAYVVQMLMSFVWALHCWPHKEGHQRLAKQIFRPRCADMVLTTSSDSPQWQEVPLAQPSAGPGPEKNICLIFFGMYHLCYLETMPTPICYKNSHEMMSTKIILWDMLALDTLHWNEWSASYVVLSRTKWLHFEYM